MVQQFPCKEPGCTGTVTYKRRVVRGLKGIFTKTSGDITKTVYLTCDKDKNHWHDYEVQEEE